MKKLFLLSLLAATVGTSHAQSIAAGTISLTGNIGYYRSTNTSSSYYSTGSGAGRIGYTTEATNSQFGTAVLPAYFVADNLAIGLNLGVNTTSSTQKTTYTNNTGFPSPTSLPDLDPNKSVRLGAFVQYYKFISEQFALIGTLGGGYQHSKSYAYSSTGSSMPVATTFTGNGYYADLTPGIAFFPIPKVGISASMGALAFSHSSNKFPETAGSTPPDNYENSSSSFGAAFGFDHLSFGGTYYFGR
ncbi:hypothetical protein [Hymenobacter daeguensis]